MKRYLTSSYNKLRGKSFVTNLFNLSGIQLSNILLTLLIFPIIIRIIGLEAFGFVTLANTFSILTGTFINFGTSENGIRDVASNTNDSGKLKSVVYNVVWIRVIIFCFYLTCLLIFRAYYEKYSLFILLSIPIVTAEVLNPLFFYVGVEKLRLFSIANLASNLLSVACIILFIKGPQYAQWTNFILGTSNLFAYTFLFLHAVFKYNLGFEMPNIKGLFATGKHNVYLTANSISTQIQLSIMVFAIGSFGNAVLLGAYAICDKIIRSTRTMSVTLSIALYPRATQIYNKDSVLWQKQRKKWKLWITTTFLAGSLVLFIFAPFLIKLLSKQRNEIAIVFLRTMAIVPTISALNSLNVIDQLIKKKTINIFRIAIVLLVLSLLLTFTIFETGNYMFYGAFALVIETCAWLLYEFAVKNTTPVHD